MSKTRNFSIKFLAFLVGCTSVAQAQSKGIRGAFFDFVENPWELTA